MTREWERRSGIEDRIQMSVPQPECGCHVVWELVWRNNVFPEDVIIRDFVACQLHAGNYLHAEATSAGFQAAVMDAVDRMRPDAN